ncbi:MAG: ABC transporter ATP-binding protein [Acidobacteria bacterium]|nr:ABC transporter ATP-binding protein [Acidobacteriota bacterium]MBU4307466.1 ABC transporter ATP-binding protein [Acidobacteriota bacterium]MCG2812890.1 ABC transporter ATP-binding protein [Candidatus Aminicenantes bacterium]
MKALEIKDLKKTFHSNFLFKKYRVLKGINLNVEKGEIYGFLGPNGAGKTTTIKCILGLLFPDQGEILIDGQPAAAVASRCRIGFLPENPYFYDYLSARELLFFSASLFNLTAAEVRDRVAALIHQVGLSGHQDLKLRKFSKGMIQRLGLAQALIHNPDFLILDEPFSGLDPIGRKDLRTIILSLREQGKTIFFSSHILQDMEMMVDRVGIILNGSMRREGKLSELISRSTQYYEIICSHIAEKELAKIQANFACRDGQYSITLASDSDINQVVESIIHNNGRIVAVNQVKMTLEDIFFNEMGPSRPATTGPHRPATTGDSR